MDLIVITLLLLAGASVLYWFIRTRLMERRRGGTGEILLAFPPVGSDIGVDGPGALHTPDPNGVVSRSALAPPSSEFDRLDIPASEAGGAGAELLSGPHLHIGGEHREKVPAISIPRVRRAVAPVPRPAEPAALPAAVEGAAGPSLDEVAVFEGKTIRFHTAPPNTMRLLPGRLEVEEGEDGHAEIRFVDLPGKAEITFGRLPGQPFRHVQLRALTVSREHARMERQGDQWIIANLSQTNPIVVNGEALPRREEKRILRDGDRIEMGEVVFRYYAA